MCMLHLFECTFPGRFPTRSIFPRLKTQNTTPGISHLLFAMLAFVSDGCPDVPLKAPARRTPPHATRDPLCPVISVFLTLSTVTLEPPSAAKFTIWSASWLCSLKMCVIHSPNFVQGAPLRFCPMNTLSSGFRQSYPCTSSQVAVSVYPSFGDRAVPAHLHGGSFASCPHGLVRRADLPRFFSGLTFVEAKVTESPMSSLLVHLFLLLCPVLVPQPCTRELAPHTSTRVPSPFAFPFGEVVRVHHHVECFQKCPPTRTSSTKNVPQGLQHRIRFLLADPSHSPPTYPAISDGQHSFSFCPHGPRAVMLLLCNSRPTSLPLFSLST